MAKKKTKTTKYKGITCIQRGKYRVRVRGTDPTTGKRVEIGRVCNGTLADAVELQSNMRRRLRAPDAKTNLTLSALMRSWLEQKAALVSEGSAIRYESHAKRILPRLGDHYVAMLRPMHVQDYITKELTGGRSERTVGASVGMLRQVARYALANGMTSLDFTLGIRASGRSKEYTLDEPNSLTVEQLREFLDVAEQTEQRWYVALYTLAFTGLRVGELLGLRWDDLDFEQQLLSVNRTVTAGRVGKPKTRASRRRIVMADDLKAALLDHRGALLTNQHPSLQEGWVFGPKSGSHYRTNPLGQVIGRITKRMELSFRFTTHGLRRTFVSLFGTLAPIDVVMDTVGHTQRRMTAHYTTVRDDRKRDASNQLLRLVTAAPKQKRAIAGEDCQTCPACGAAIRGDSASFQESRR